MTIDSKIAELAVWLGDAFQSYEQTAQAAIEAAENLSAVASNVRKINTSTNRAPLPTDDETQGYSVGSRWIWKGQEWVASVTTPGGARWVPNEKTANPEMFGATGAASPENAAFLEAAASGATIETGDQSYVTSLAMTALPKRIEGRGQITFGSGNKLAPNWRNIDTPLSARGDGNGFNTAFNGDWRHSFLPMAAQVSGAATLGQPTTGFVHNDEFAPIYLFMRNVDSGHNQSLTGNGGRTTWPGVRLRGMHSGQGGMMGFSSSIFVYGETRPGVTSFLANPAAANMNAEAYAGANGVYLNPLEINAEDQGWDVGAIGAVVNLKRGNKTGALQAFWSGVRIQSTGTEAINSGFQISGNADTGLDFTKAEFGTGQSAIALKAGQRIYFEAASANNWHKTANGDSWISYNTTNNGIEVFADGSEILRIRSAQFLVRNTDLALETGNLSLLSSSAVVAIGGAKVVGQRQAAIPNAAAGTEIASINAILAALRTHGLIAT